MDWFSKLLKKFEQRPPAVAPGKNDLCWCGSGTKYKKCHLVKDKLYFKEHPQKKAAVKKACSPISG
ncbi:MAG: methionine aminopeptidase [Deltaproteobacteria bacterium]|nr:MAG: methionine aminopeptidase [Deltaproteobacteria bacterium]